MGKRGRVKTRDRRSTKHIKVFDAAQLVSMAEHCTAWADNSRASAVNRHAGRIAGVMLSTWQDSQVVLRVDREFVDALLGSDTDVPLMPDWLTRLPFNAVAVSLPAPLSLYDGHALCHYMGFLACGIRPETPSAANAHLVAGGRPPYGDGQVVTRYGPLAQADGVRFLWLYNEDQDPTSRCQTVTVTLQGKFAKPDCTLTELIEAQRSFAEEHGQAWGDELPILVPLSVQLLAYLTAQEPDLEWLPPEQMSRPHQLRNARVANVGWRVGAALRTWQKRDKIIPPALDTPHAAPRAVPPHIRRAHWHRVRFAARDQAGHIIGSTTGVHGVDWDYQLRWYPPTPVNASDSAPPPVVRQIVQHPPAVSP